ncbi:MAG: metal-dependent transcriptional regulator [Planctomycetaceae bacterium]
MPSLTVENYLKAALQISMQSGNDWVSTGQLAEALMVSPGTVTSMLKTLDSARLATYKPYEGAKLTEQGRRLAMRMLRRHRLIELFLFKTLDLTWDQVHEEAEHMEHAVSDFLVDRIDDYLGHPEADPHGDPIPTADGKLRGNVTDAVPLTDCPPGTRVRFVRVTNQGADFLRYLSDAGFEIGRLGTVTENNAEAGIVTTDLDGRSLSMGHPAAEQLLVERVAE